MEVGIQTTCCLGSEVDDLSNSASGPRRMASGRAVLLHSSSVCGVGLKVLHVRFVGVGVASIIGSVGRHQGGVAAEHTRSGQTQHIQDS